MHTSYFIKPLHLLFIVAALGVVMATPFISRAATMCTEEAMQCPDGSYVGRTGPNCEFVCGGQIKPKPASPIMGGGGYSGSISGPVSPYPDTPVSSNPWSPYTNYPGTEHPYPGQIAPPVGIYQGPYTNYPNIEYPYPGVSGSYPPVAAPEPGVYTNYPGIEHPDYSGQIAPPVGIYKGPTPTDMDPIFDVSPYEPEVRGGFFGAINNWFSGIFSWLRW